MCFKIYGVGNELALVSSLTLTLYDIIMIKSDNWFIFYFVMSALDWIDNPHAIPDVRVWLYRFQNYHPLGILIPQNLFSYSLISYKITKRNLSVLTVAVLVQTDGRTNRLKTKNMKCLEFANRHLQLVGTFYRSLIIGQVISYYRMPVHFYSLQISVLCKIQIL